MISSSQHSSTSRNAFVTLLTSDHYLPGALVLAESLRLSHGISNKGKHRAGAAPSSAAGFQLVALITPDTLSVQSIKALRRSGLFDWIVGVEPIGFRQLLASSSPTSASKFTATDNARPGSPAIIDSDLNAKIMEMERNLNLLGRPDLTNTLTKLHAWRLGRDLAHLVAPGVTPTGSVPQQWQGFDKIVFLDADTLVLRPIDHLFRLGTNVSFAAAPDTGWPDAFNSGVMMLVPSSRTFEAIRSFARTTGSWDGADQGLLNDFYGPEDGSEQFSVDSQQGAASAPGGGWKRLSFRYNVTSHGGYTFAPAYQRYGQSINIVHFIGQNKPWNRPRPSGTAEPNPLVGPRDLDGQPITPDKPDYLLALWHSAFACLYPSSGSASPDSEIEIVHTERGVEVVERRKFTVPTFQAVWDAEARGDTSINQAAGASSTLASARHSVREAAYASLPLDGRTSLIAPAPEIARSPSPRTPTQQSIDAEAKAREASATQTATPVAIPGRADDGKKEDYDDDSPQHFSPPKLSWNPAHDPPPSGSDASLYQMRIPIDTVYSNVWDAGQRTPRTLAEQKAAFFVPQAAASQHAGARGHGGPGYIPAQLRRDRVFDNLGSAKPDPSKVKPIFPWEAKQSATNAPTRVFPDEPRLPSPPPVAADKVAAHGNTRDDSTLASAAPQATASAQRSRGLPANLSYVNAWDQAGAIGNFANAWNRRNQPRSSPDKHRSRKEEPGHNAGLTSIPRSGDGRIKGGGKASSPNSRGAASSMRPATAEAMERRSSLQEGDGTRDGEASDSRDGDDESSEGEESSANEEPSQVVTDRGATPSPTNARQAGWPREGPGRGYMRKAESSMHAQMNATPRSPRMGSRVLSYTSTATEGEGKSGGGRFSSSSSASASTITTSENAAAARQRAKDRIRPDGWVSTGSAGSGMSSPPPGYHSASTLRGMPGTNAAGNSRNAYAPGHYQSMTGRRRETNSSNESQSGESGANSPTALLSPSLGSASGSMPFLMNSTTRSFGNAMEARTRMPAPSELDEPFSSSPVNLRSELSRQARTHQQAKYASASRGHRPA